MAIHVIPESEKHLHEENADCSCEPTFKIQQSTGEMVYIHQIKDPEKYFNNTFAFKSGR